MKVQHLIFDLDDTLYPGNGAMNKGITQRMMQAVADYFKVSYDEGIRLRAENIKNFSTTLEWLTSEGLTDIESYFAYVHPENEADELSPDLNLRPFLESIKIPKIILTNAPSEHAERVLEKLNVRGCFDFICDIRYSGLKGKPYSSAFKNALKAAGGTIEDSLFIDDLVKYTDGWEALGGTAVQVGNNPGHRLNKNASCATKEPPLQTRQTWQKGRTFHIDSLYGLADLIKDLESE